MLIRQTGPGPAVHIWAPAKLNLLLEVLGKRPDGYHEIMTLMVGLRLFDRLTFTRQSGTELHLNCRWTRGARPRDGDPLPQGADNLAWRAMRLLQQRSGCEQGGRVELVKRIPPASGLGGGSSNAAAALVAANTAWGLNWHLGRLALLAAELGSDVPFFLTRRNGRGPVMSVCRGRGEDASPVAAPCGLHFVVVRPPRGLSTAAVYARCQPSASAADCRSMISALAAGDYNSAAAGMTNRLQPAASGISPQIEQLQGRFDALAPLAHQLSGSGSAYFGWFRNARQARHGAARLRGWGYRDVWCAQSI